jgi:uncharacterized protein
VYSASEFASLKPDGCPGLRALPALRAVCKTRRVELRRTPTTGSQYQHDVNQSDLARSLDTVVEDCVNSAA